MTDLNPKARALFQQGRGALRPTSSDRGRIEAALRTRLGTDALPHDNGGVHAASRASWQSMAGVASGICMLGAAAFFALRPASSVPAVRARVALPAATQSAPSDPPPTAAGVVAPPLPATEATEATEAAPASETPASPAPRVRDRLAREVALLSRATSELRAGHAAAALKTLSEHQRSFPNGALSEERRAAQAQALCSLGRLREGRAELSQLSPGSPAAARAEQVCAAKRSPAGVRQ